METIFGNSNGRNATRRSVYQATPFGTPPLGRQVSCLHFSLAWEPRAMATLMPDHEF